MFLIRSLIISREVFFVLFSQIEKSPEITGDFSGFRTFLRSSAAFFTASDFTCHLHISCCYIFYALSQKLPEPFLIIDGPDGQINIIFTGHTDKFFCGNLFIYIHGMYSVFSAGSADFVCRLFKKKITTDKAGNGYYIVKDVTDQISTGVNVLTVDKQKASTIWYDLQGRRYNQRPTLPGVYINGGKKIMIR